MNRSKTILRLRYNALAHTMAPREIKWRRRLSRRLGTIYYDPLERRPILWGQLREQGARCPQPALSNVLAADFYLCLPPRLFGYRCAGSDAGFFCHGS